MSYSTSSSEQRKEMRVGLELPALINIGSQISLQGKLKDLSFKSAFIVMQSNVYLKTNDEVGFVIQCSSSSETDLIQGMARVSRIAVGEGMAIYFTEMDEDSLARLKGLLK
jgi:hypothetical protein